MKKEGNFQEKKKTPLIIKFWMIIRVPLILGFLTVFFILPLILQPKILDFRFFNIINLGLILLGITITVYSSIILLKNADFSSPKELQIDPIAQNLVTIGLYKYIRHPIYTGIIILYLGYCLFFRSLLCILILNPLLMLSLFLKARQEEKDLKKLFDAVYKKYMLKTGILFPRIRKKEVE